MTTPILLVMLALDALAIVVCLCICTLIETGNPAN